MTRGALLAALRTMPTRLRGATDNTGSAQLATPPRPGEWSMLQVVRHLVEGDRAAFVPRLRRMLAEDRPRFESRAPAPGDEADLATLLGAFADARGQAVRLLESLDDAGWRREGVSPSRGPLDVETYARTMAEHDAEHLRQIQDVRTTLGLLPKRCEAGLPLPREALLQALGESPARLRAAVAGLGADTARRPPADGEWSVKEVVAHLRDLEAALFLPRLRRMAAEDTPAFESFDPVAWARSRDWREGSLVDDVAGFERGRAETMAFLRSLTADALRRPGLSGYFGPLTLAQYATHMVDHDLEHLAQIVATRAVVCPLPDAARRAVDALAAAGLDDRAIALEQPARTAAEAAAAVGCDVGQIVKSLVFRGRRTDRAWLVLTSGANRVDDAAVAAAADEPLEKADADFVRAATGFAIGGVPPLGHPTPLPTLVDADLGQYAEIWAAAGHPSTVFPATPDELIKVTAGRWTKITG